MDGLFRGFSVGMNDAAAMAQVLVAPDFGDVQALGNLVDAERLLAVEGLGYDGRALGFFAEAPPAAAHPAPGAGRGQPGMGALADEFALELGQGGKQVKHEPALGGGRVDGVGEGHEPHALLLQVAHYLEQVFERAPELVELVDVDRVARAQPAQQLVEFGATGAGLDTFS